MQSNVNTSVERIIAKIDNDFNPDNSDWIPRVGAWVYDAMSQINALRKYRKKVKLNVHDRIAYSLYPIDSPNLIVRDSNNTIIDRQKYITDDNCDSSTGYLDRAIPVTPNTISIIENEDAAYVPDVTIAEHINSNNKPPRYNIHNYDYIDNIKKNYTLIDNNKIELNYDAKYIYVETEYIESVYSQTYNCEVPVIPEVGLLVEMLAFYCVYKMLTRGYKHPVFNLGASQYGTNPFYEWKTLKDQAKRAVIIDAQGNINVTDNNLFRSSFFITSYPLKD